MTWAYQADSTSTNFAHYNYDQATMYNAILDCVQNVVLQNPDIKGVIPSGTAVQNLRTGHLGDTVTDDGRHLSKGIGRYTAGLTYLAAITGYDVTYITAVPNVDNYPNYSASRKENLRMVAEHLDCIKEAVVSAVAQPFAITPSVKFPYVPVTPEIPEAPDAGEGILNTTLSALSNEDREYLTSKGYDPDRYMLLDLTVKANAYYDSSKSNFSGNLFTPSEGGNTYLKFLGTQSFSRNELVNGTLIRVDAGYKYRPEGWISGVKNESSARPAIVYSADAELTVVTDEWWGSWEYRGFNICKGTTSSNQDITVDEKGNFKIYIPVATKSPLNADDIAYLKSLGLDPNCFMALDYTYTMSAYYNASQKSAISIGTSTLHKEFLATNEKFTRYDIPVGSVIRINTTYRYRAEAWITLDAKVASDDRPARITAATTVVDAAWWADWGYRAFNVQTKNNAVMTEDGADALRIYVPVNGSRYSELEDEDVAYLEAMGLDPDEYMILNFEYFVNAYYNSTQHSELINTDTLSKRYIATEIFTREELGIGSVIRITKAGYQYRPDAWTALDKKTSGRPGTVTEEAVIVTEEWWGNFNYRGFNISRTDSKTVTEDEVSAFKIYVKVK